MNDDLLRKANEALKLALERERVAKQTLEQLGPVILQSITPSLDSIDHKIMMMGHEISEAVAKIKVQAAPDIYVPEMKTPRVTVNVPEFDIPTPQVNYTPPEIKIPPIKVPKPEVTVKIPKNTDILKGLKSLEKVISNQEMPKFPEPIRHTFTKPLPVILTDGDGKPYMAINQGGGGRLANKKERSDKADTTKVTVGTTSTSVVAGNSNRLEVTLVNDSDEIIYLGYDEPAVLNEGVRLNASGGSIIIDKFTGAINAICTSGSKNLTVVDVTL